MDNRLEHGSLLSSFLPRLTDFSIEFSFRAILFRDVGFEFVENAETDLHFVDKAVEQFNCVVNSSSESMIQTTSAGFGICLVFKLGKFVNFVIFKSHLTIK